MKKNLVYLTIMILLIVIVALVDKSYKTAPKEAAKNIFQIDTKTVNKVKIQNQNEKVFCQKIDDQWQIIEPKALSADEKVIQTILEQFSKVKGSDFFTDNSLDLYGLAKPVVSITLQANNKTYTLYRGDKAPNGSNYYAKTNLDQQIFTVSQHEFEKTGLVKPLEDLRDKDFLQINEEELQIIYFNQITFFKRKNNWFLEPLPEDSKVDTAKTNMMANDLLNIKAIQFIEEEQEIKRILALPTKLPIYIKTRKRAIRLNIFQDNKKYFAQLEGDPTIYEISPFDHSSTEGVRHYLQTGQNVATTNPTPSVP